MNKEKTETGLEATMDVEEVKSAFAYVRMAIFSALLVLCFFALHGCFRWGWVGSSSMEPTLETGGGYIGAYITDQTVIQRGDIVTFSPYTAENNYMDLPQSARTDIFVKRVIGLPGDTVSIRDNVLYVNGEPQVEPYLSTLGKSADFDEVHVPVACYFMLGDNRCNSEDSRVYGFIPRENLVCKVVFHYQTLARTYIEWRNKRILNSF